MRFSLAITLLLLVSCGTTRSPEQSRRASPEIETFGSGETLHYLVLGDSTAVGEGGAYANGIAVMTARHLAAGRQVIVKNLGVSGAQVTDVLREQLPRIDGFVPDVVLLAAGANDVTHLTTAGSVKRDLRQIVEALVSINRDVRIVMTGAPDMSTPPRIPWLLRRLAGWRTNALNRVFREQAERYGLTFAPIAEQTGPLFETDKTLFSSDEFHPNDRGYATWIPVISRALDRALARGSS
ncbi:MAG TPA: SGNH/GDSL hydrolase family protein [Thermoanaerobaculia bacterium]|nr:SGNH/GDSL hydrolase family protein [Thermoanaerobaculia bacterium]